MALLPELLALLQLSKLVEQPSLSQQQLAACGSPAAADLARQLYAAAAQCQEQLQPHGSRMMAAQQHYQLATGSSRQLLEAMAVDDGPDQELRRHRQQQVGAQEQQQQLLEECNPSSVSSVRSVSSTADMWQALHHGSDVAVSWDPSGSGCDVNNHTSGGGHTVAAAVVPQRVGAVVVQAWPGRQRGYQPRQLLVAGGYAQLLLCVYCLHGGRSLHCLHGGLAGSSSGY